MTLHIEGTTRTKVCVSGFGRCEVRDLLWISLDPTKESVELAHMFNSGGRKMTLQRTNKDAHVKASMRKVRDCPE